MTYFVNVRDKERGVRHIEESILDGIVPQRVIDLMLDKVVDEDIQLCRLPCPGAPLSRHGMDQAAYLRQVLPNPMA